MKRTVLVFLAALAALVVLTTSSAAGLFGFAVGAYGGMNLPLEDDATAGTVLGGKVRVLTPVPMIGVDAWYSHFTYEDPGTVYAAGDWSLALDGEGFNLFGLDVLVGGVRGVPGFKWYGIVGVTAAEFEEFGKNESERKLGGEIGLGLELVPPALGLGIEGRGMMMFPDLSGDFEDNLMTFTVGVNYYF